MTEIAQRMSEVLGEPQVSVLIRDGMLIGPIDGSDVMTNYDLVSMMRRAERAGNESLLEELRQRWDARTKPSSDMLGFL